MTHRGLAGLVAALALVAVAAPPVPAGAQPRLTPPVHRDGRDPGPLDLATASFGQVATRLELAIGTRGPWQPGSLEPGGGPRAVCLVLSYGAPPRPRMQLCVTAGAGRPALLRSELDATGAPAGEPAPVRADVGRDGDRTLVASFTALEAGLPRGHFAWRVDTRWSGDAACAEPAGCEDHIPRRGFVPSRSVLLAAPPCFGAAARDRLHPCANPALARTVVPSPDEALLAPNAACAPTGVIGLVATCAFGVAPERAVATAALIGDSHAGHWRAALEVVAQELRWAGVSLTRTSCPYSHARTTVAGAGCARWNREVRRWLERHPEVRTVFVSENAYTRFAGDAVAGYRAAWRALPPTVRHVFVLRDTPIIVAPQAGCVTRLLRARRPIGRRCSQARALNLVRDPAAVAARSGADRRVRLVDLTAHLCGADRCPAVIGGVLVRKDGDHLTSRFSTTLGPFVLRAIRGQLGADDSG